MPAFGILSDAWPDDPHRRRHNARRAAAAGAISIADKAYDADHWRAWLARRCIRAVIPNKANRKRTYRFDARRYKDRNSIERLFGRLKDFRRIAMGYDKNAENFMAALCLAAVICYWI